MDVRPVHGTGSGNAHQKWFATFRQQWTDMLGSCAWYDFTLLKIQGEFAPYTGRWELELGLLGFEFTLTYVYDNAFNERMKDAVAEITAELDKP